MSPRAFQGRYAPEPLNTGGSLDAQIDDRVQQFIQSQSLMGSLVPASIPQQTVIRPVVTSLPSTASDGDEVRFVADSDNGVVWLLRYRDSGSDYPWEFLGGSPLYGYIAAEESQTTTNTWGSLATIGPRITVPLSGDYIVQAHSTVRNTNAGANRALMGISVGGNAPDAYASADQSATDHEDSLDLIEPLIGLDASTVLTMVYQCVNSGDAHKYRGLLVTPVRVGAR